MAAIAVTHWSVSTSSTMLGTMKALLWRNSKLLSQNAGCRPSNAMAGTTAGPSSRLTDTASIRGVKTAALFHPEPGEALWMRGKGERVKAHGRFGPGLYRTLPHCGIRIRTLPAAEEHSESW